MTTQIFVQVPDDLAAASDEAAVMLNRTLDEVIRQAIKQYLEDFDDLFATVERLRDPADPVPDWDEVRRELLGSD